MSLSLYTYFRSSAAWRVRIALAWKGLDYTSVPIHLMRDGGEQHGAVYKALNPQELVPALADEGQIITQSLAICEYLEERFPERPLLPADLAQRAQARSLALAIACDIHPLNNLRVLQYLKGTMGHDQGAVDTWYRHWVEAGFAGIEQTLAARDATQYCVGHSVSMADICLVPQVFNARRFKIDLAAYPRIVAIDAHLTTLPAFADTHPSTQADAE